MPTVPINEPEAEFIGLIRLALSEADNPERLKAIRTVKLDIESARLDKLNSEFGTDWMQDPKNAELVQWIASSTTERHEAGFDLSQTGQRFESKNQLKLNVAEHIGLLIFHSIQDEKFEGLHSFGGILDQVSDDARNSNTRGAKDTDTLRKNWNTYRGVVHLGLAINYCEENPDQGFHVLHLAELFERTLSENCPKGTSKPYVDQGDQTHFAYKSKLYGPRFLNRGLPFGVD